MSNRFWEDELRRITLFIFSYVLWLLLTWTLNWQHLVVGGLISLVTALFFGNLFIEKPSFLLQPKRWLWFLYYIPVFLWEMAKANFDVAYRVVHPKMPIRPGIVKIRTNIKSEMGKTFLANSITLTPGTFTMDLKDQYLYIHCIYVRETDIKKASEAIAGKFERILIKIFD